MPAHEVRGPLSDELDLLQVRIDAARSRAGGLQGSAVLVQDLETAHEELRVAGDELRVQQEHITQLLEGQQLVRWQHERMMALLPVPTLTTDEHGIIRAVNAPAAVLADTRVARLVGRPVLTLFSLDQRAGLRRLISTMRRDGRAFQVPASVTRRDGTSTEVTVSASVLPGLASEVTWMLLEGELATSPGSSHPVDRIPSVLARLAALPATAVDRHELLLGAARLSKEALGDLVDLTVSYGAPDEPQALASTDPMAQQMDGAQIRYSEGPCVDAFRQSVVVVTDDIHHDSRWPDLRPHIPETIGAVVAVPLRTSETLSGALNVYSRARGADSALVETVEVLASTIGAVLYEFGLKSELQSTADEMQRALTSRAVIDQAKGMIMADRGCDADEAFAHLVHLSSEQQVKVRDLAGSMVARLSRRG